MKNYQILLIVIISFVFGYLTYGWSQQFGALSDQDVDSHMSKDQDSEALDTNTEMMDKEMDMMAEMVEVDKNLPLPQVKILDSFQGKMGEYTLQIGLENFSFTPKAVDEEAVQGEGHAHVFVNDEKAGRVYGEWVYVPSSYFVQGRNKITISLNANNHAFWTINDSSITDTIFVEYQAQ